jgi:hypothetical protein
MANTTVPVTDLVLGSNADVAGTTVVAANTHVITPTKRDGKVVVRLKNTTASTKVWTVVAGDLVPAESSGQGNLDVSLTDGSTTPTIAFLVLESARFMHSDGTIRITVAASTTGTITAFQLP